MLLPIRHKRNSAEMSAGGVAANIKTIAVTIEFLGVHVHPGDTVAHLLGHDAQIATSLFDRDEVERNVMCPCVHKQLCWKSVIFCLAAKPSPTMDKYENRSLCALRAIDIECLDRAWTI